MRITLLDHVHARDVEIAPGGQPSLAPIMLSVTGRLVECSNTHALVAAWHTAGPDVEDFDAYAVITAAILRIERLRGRVEWEC